MFQLYFYVPESHLEITKKAIFEVGAGKYEKYDSCCFVTKGLGQFRPLDGSKPFLGQTNKYEQVEEFKVETLVQENDLPSVLVALKKSHPYEEVAFGFIEIYTSSDQIF